MTGDDNPYRFVDVSAEEQELEGLEWDLRDYVEPDDEPIFGPDEIVLIAKRWNGFAMTAIVLQAIVVIFLALLLPPVQSAPRGVIPPPRAPAPAALEPGAIVVFAVAAFVAQSPIGIGCYLLARSLRYPAGRSLTIGAICLVPILNLVGLAALGYLAVHTLRRHGIRAGFFGAVDESLPCAAD